MAGAFLAPGAGLRSLRDARLERVLAAVESGQRVVLTVRGGPVADIVPHQSRSERRASEELLADLKQVSELAAELGISSAAEDFDTDLTTDDMPA